jgi:hypothetical protein
MAGATRPCSIIAGVPDIENGEENTGRAACKAVGAISWSK